MILGAGSLDDERGHEKRPTRLTVLLGRDATGRWGGGRASVADGSVVLRGSICQTGREVNQNQVVTAKLWRKSAQFLTLNSQNWLLNFKLLDDL